MITVNGSLNNKDLTIVGSGLQPTDVFKSDIIFTIDGYDKLVVPFTILGQPAPLPPDVMVDPKIVLGYTDKKHEVNVLVQGTITASCDNPDILVDIDNVNRKVILSVDPNDLFKDHQGLLTISVPNYTDAVIPVSILKMDIIDFNMISNNGFNSPYKDPIVFEVIGTTRPITVTCDNPRINVSVKSKMVTVTTTQPEQGILTVKGDGIMPKNGNISTYALQMQPTWNPVNKEAHYTGEIKVSFPGMTRSDISYKIKDNTTPDMIVSINEDPADQEGFIITSLSGNENKEITFSAPGYDDLVETVTFTKDNIAVTQGNNVETFLDEPIVLNVTGTTKDFLVQSMDTDILDVQLTGSDILVTPNKDGNTQIKIFGIFVNEVIVDVRIKPLLPITTTSVTNKEEEKYTNTINISVTNPNQGVTYDLVSAPLGVISARQVGTGNDYELSATGPASGTITFKAKNHAPETIEIVFKDLDPIKYTISPSNIVEINQIISVQVTDPVNGAGVTTNIGGTIQTDDKTNGLYEFTSTNIETEELTLSCAGYKDTKIQLTFKDIYRGPQFSVTTTNVVFNETDGYHDIEILDLETDISVTVKDQDLLDAFVYQKAGKVFLRFDLIDQIEKDETTEVTLSGPGQQDVVITVTVINNYIPLKYLELDKTTARAYETEETSVVSVTPSTGDNYVVTVDPGVNYRVDIDRIFLSANNPGEYKVKLELNGYYPKEFYFIVTKKPVVLPPVPNGWFDLGQAPQVNIQATEDTFVEVVFNEPAISTDREKLAYVLEHGSPNLKGFELTLCQYQEVMSETSTSDRITSDLGGIMNFNLYNKIMTFVYVESYFTFKSCAMLLLKTMKVYKDDSYRLVNLLRFKDTFKGTKKEWDDYETVIRFFSDFLKNNGQGLDTTNLTFDDDTKAKFDRFLLENFIP